MIPIFDSPRARTFPYVNVTLIAINFIVFFYELALNQQAFTREFTQLDVFISHWGNVPACTLGELGRHTTLAAAGACSAGDGGTRTAGSDSPDPAVGPVTSSSTSLTTGGSAANCCNAPSPAIVSGSSAYADPAHRESAM